MCNCLFVCDDGNNERFHKSSGLIKPWSIRLKQMLRCLNLSKDPSTGRTFIFLSEYDIELKTRRIWIIFNLKSKILEKNQLWRINFISCGFGWQLSIYFTVSSYFLWIYWLNGFRMVLCHHLAFVCILYIDSVHPVIHSSLIVGHSSWSFESSD